MLTSSIPMVVLAPFTGVLADLDRKTIVVAMDVFRGLIILTWPLFSAQAFDHAHSVCCHSLFLLCGVLFGPAISATIPGLVKKDELVKANSLNNFSRAATMILGPVLGAFLLGTTGYFGPFH